MHHGEVTAGVFELTVAMLMFNVKLRVWIEHAHTHVDVYIS